MAATAAAPAVKKRPKNRYDIIENLCVGCGLCLDQCPPKVNSIGFKFFGDLQEGAFRCYIDQKSCISCQLCFDADACPSGALIEIRHDGDIRDFRFTPEKRIEMYDRPFFER
ncbi:MAG: 4Fe-4S dicluster domain-containing protein [Chlorobiales bacterium]|nr:4Fe-4S dicluster domain-containing protein [Chlorobiales bacterium]